MRRLRTRNESREPRADRSVSTPMTGWPWHKKRYTFPVFSRFEAQAATARRAGKGKTMRLPAICSALGLSIAGSQMALAQSAEVFSAIASSREGTQLALVIHKTGDQLRFSMSMLQNASGFSGMPSCERAILRLNGTFETYCSGFNNRGRISKLFGTLETAQLDPNFYQGPITFRLSPGRLSAAKPTGS